MERLIHLRKQLIEQFKRVDNLKFDPPRGKENQFLIEFKEIIERDMTQDFSVQELCKLIGLSRTQLHRKLKALTDQSTSQYVRSIRLNKAKELLKTTDRTIAEIAYDVGFQSPSYFSRMFSQTWMQSPSEWREQNL